MSRRTKRLVRAGLICGTLLLVGACTRPESMLVREASDPVNADKDVAFRTTYYFRVFDYCAIKNRLDNKTVDVPLNDTLYRFIMTGKSSTLFSNIRFESGTLSAQEIDPFGSNVHYDEELGRFRFQSRDDVEAEARRELAVESYRRLLDLYGEIANKKPQEDPDLKLVRDEFVKTLTAFIAEFRKTSQALIDPRVAAIGAGTITTDRLPVTEKDGRYSIPFTVHGAQSTQQKFTLVLEDKEGEAPTARLETEGGEVVAELAKPPPIECLQDNIPTRRGFQILGPEGWRTFDQDERLLMAMSADAQPLIGTMKELSQRLIQSRAPALAFQRILPVERLRVANTRQTLDSPAPGTPPTTILDRTIETFKTEAEGS